jgi:hypothetical protein
MIMRPLWIALPLVLTPVPAFAAPAASPTLPPEFSDPAMADKLGRMAGALTKALMDMPVGEVEAAVQGREPTPADRAKHVRDEIGGPAAERNVEARVAASGKQMQAMSKALVDSLPSIMQSLDQAEKQLERAAANIPDPTYPRR